MKRVTYIAITAVMTVAIVLGSGCVGDEKPGPPVTAPAPAPAPTPPSQAPAPPSKPPQTTPAKEDGAALFSHAYWLGWDEHSGAVSYRLQVSVTPDFTKPVIEQSAISHPSYEIPESVLRWGTVYYWRVSAAYESRASEWSEPRQFATPPEPSGGPPAPYFLASAPASGSLGEIAFTSFRDGNEEIYVMDAEDGSGIRRLTVNDVVDMYPAGSPDGSKIAFTSQGDIYIMNAATGTILARLTEDTGRNWCGNWSPDGNKIAFTSDRDGDREIYVVSVADPADLRNLSGHPAGDYDPVWSPDGSRIAFVSDRTGNGDIYIMDADTGTILRQLTDHDAGDLFPAWSPLGDKIAFASYRDGNVEIYTGTADGPLVLTNLTSNPAQDTEPAWSPDGTEIAFVSDRSVGHHKDIYVMDALTGLALRQLTEETVAAISPAWILSTPVLTPTIIEATDLLGKRPDIILDSTGRPLIAYETWFDSTTAIGFAVKTGITWGLSYISDPAAELSGRGYYPELVLTDTGEGVIYSINSDDAFRLRFSEQTGTGWSTPSFAAPTSANYGSAAVATDGTIHFVYVGTYGSSTIRLYHITKTDGTWSSPVPLTPTTAVAISAATASTGPCIAHIGGYYFSIRAMYAYLDSSDSWVVTPVAPVTTIVLDPSHNNIAVATGPDGMPHLIYYDYDFTLGTRQTKYTRLTAVGWTTPEIIDNNTTSSLALAIASDGTPRVCYLRPDPAHSGHAQLWYAWRTSDGTWHNHLVRDSVGYMANRLTMVLDPEDRPHIAYCDYHDWKLYYATAP